MARNRWELEENRKKKALQAVQNAIKQGASYKGNAVSNTVNNAIKKSTGKKTTTSSKATKTNTASKSASKPAGAKIPTFLQGSGKTTTAKVSTPTVGSSGLNSLRSLPVLTQTRPAGARIPSMLRGSTPTTLSTDIWREDITKITPAAQRSRWYTEGAQRRTSNTDSRTGTNTSRASTVQQLQRNSLAWHATRNQAEKDALKKQNDVLRERLGLAYENGTTYDPRTGTSYSKPTEMLFARLTDRDVRKVYDAHKEMQELYARADETWSEQDQRRKDTAISELKSEMKNVLSKYGLNWKENGIGASESWGMPDSVSDRTAVERLRAAGADQNTINMIEENIQMREEANRLGQGVTAVIKRAVGSIPALIETARQQSENVEQSRQNPEYVQLEQQEQQLEAQLQSMPSQDIDGKVPAEYMEVYNRLQEVRKRKNALAVATPVDQNAWGQTMMREANEAQKNATAGMSDGARFLTNTGISIAGNAPTMALSAVPGVGTALGAALMGASAAGQRAAELNAQGVSPGEAFGRGIVSGLVEGVTEKMPLKQMASLLKTGGTSAVRNILRQMGIEAKEESASYMMNYIADLAANAPDAQFSFSELAQNALGGAISGLAFGTAGTLLGRRRAITEQLEQQGLQGAELTDTVNAIETVADTIGADTDQSLIKANTLVRKIKQAGDVIEANGKVVELTGQEFPKGDTSLTDQVTQFFNAIGGKVTRPGFGDVALTRRGVKDSVSHGIGRKKAISFAAVPDIIRNGVQIDYQDNWKGRNYQTYIFAGRIAIDGIPHDMGVIVRSNDAHNRFYVHEVVQIEKGDTSTFKTGTNQMASVPGDDVSPLSDISISQTTANINQQSANSQALGRRMAELDAQKRQAENLLPGAIRDRAVQQAEQELQQVQQKARASAAAQPQPMQSAGQQTDSMQVPAAAAMQYGKTPQQAMLEAQERARSEQAQAERDMQTSETVDELMQAWTNKKAAEQQAERTLAGLTLTQHDIELAQNAARTGVDSQNWEQADNPENARIYGSTLRAVREADQPIRQFFAQRANAMQSEAQTAADAIALYAKDKRFGGLYQRETMERNIRDIFGKKHQNEAESIIKTYIEPVHKAVADGNRLKNRLRGRVKALKLDKHESALTQMALENEAEAAAEYIKNNKIKMTPKKQQKIEKATSEFRNIYNELYQEINRTLLLNGQEPAPFRKNYAPHFVKDKPDTIIGRVRFALGLGKDSTVEIPTDIAGITDTFRPGKKWFGNLLQREGEITDYDAVAGFDRYVETAADVITLTDSIQRLRALEDQVRYTLSDAGVKETIDKIKASDLDALAQREKIEQVYDDNKTTVQKLIVDITNQKKMGMGRFVTELRRYTDNLAGKKSREDRGWEDFANRQIYSVAKKIEGRVAANMISLNPGSWLTNFIPITQASGEVSVPNLIRGMYQTVKANVKDDGYVDASAFLTNRYGSQQLDRTLTQKVSDLSSAPMEILDHFTANTIHRARYTQNINNGMSMNEAIDDADAFTAALMADRSKGALPTAFNSTNPVRKVFTMFQVEVNNQLSYLFKDMPKAQRKKGVAAVAAAYTKVFVGAYLYNMVYSQITGRDAAFDPIGMIADALGIGDDEDEEKTTAERLAGLAEDIGGQIPFVGGILFDGGRVPITSALPNFANLGKAIAPGMFGVEWTPDKRLQTAAKELAKPATYLLPPFGGGAVKKAIEGFATVNAGGSYTYDNNGNLQLQFPAYGQNPADYAAAMLFGKWSSKEAQQYIDSGFKGLSADETRIYNGLRDEMGVDPRKAMNAVLSLRGFESVKNDEGKTIESVKEQQRRALFENADLTPEQKQWIDKEFLVNPDSDEQPADYSDYTNFVLSMYDSEDRRADAEEAVQHGLTVDQFVQWNDRISQIKDMEDRNGKARYNDAEVRKMVLDEVLQDSALSSSEKQAIADYVLISSMESDTQKELWETVAKGKVNASDFIRFNSDISDYEENAKGTETDNMRNVATILRGYEGLTDEQRDVLFQTYNGTMSNNPFHVSTYEKAVMENSLYQELTDEGKAALRALTNEYEQYINEGRELDEWRAKAYMAEKEAGINPGIYALYRTVLDTVNAKNDGNTNRSQEEVATAVRAIPGLTQYQRAYIWQSANKDWKKNPFGNATVSEYKSGTEEAINPVAGGTLSSSFGPRSAPIAGASNWHKAIDIAAPAGTPVQAVKSGTVTSSGWVEDYGWTVHIRHADGTETEYHHMQSQSPLQAGQQVKQGEQIGAVGSTGISTGPHLDLQAWKDGHIVDPLTIIPDYGDASGYVYDGTVSAGVISSGVQEAQSSKSSKKSSGSSSTGLKKLKGFKSLPTF